MNELMLKEGQDKFHNWCLSMNKLLIEKGPGALTRNMSRFSEAFNRFYVKYKSIMDIFINNIYINQHKDAFYLYYYYLSVRNNRSTKDLHKLKTIANVNWTKQKNNELGKEKYEDNEILEGKMFDLAK